MRQLRVFPRFENAAEWLTNFMTLKENEQFAIVQIRDSREIRDLSGKVITSKSATKYAVVYGKIEYQEQEELRFGDDREESDSQRQVDVPIRSTDGFDDGVGIEL